MEIIIIICLIIIIYFIYKLKYSNKNNNLDTKIKEEKVSFFPSIEIIENNELVPSKNKLIKNENVQKTLSTIDNIVPKSLLTAKNIKNTKELAENGKLLFSANIKDTEKLLSAGKNKFYGTQVNKRNGKFTGQTKFTKESNLTNNINKSQLVNAGFNAASMIVGQYYMSEINDKLEEINEKIDVISNYLESEYQSKILHIASKIKEIIENQNEILTNEETRKNAYNDNKELEYICTKLLGQANIQISKEIKEQNLDYKNYEKKIEAISKWFIRQQLTEELLLKIGDLRYVLAKGNETSKLSHTQYNHYSSQTNIINKELEIWHNNYINKFGIDIHNQRKQGKLFKIRKQTIGKIKEEWNYKKLENNITNKINSQINSQEFKLYENDIQDEKIIIQKYKGKYYNLPLKNDKSKGVT